MKSILGRDKSELKNDIEASEARVLLEIESLNNKTKTFEKENLNLNEKWNFSMERIEKITWTQQAEISISFIVNQIKQLTKNDRKWRN